MRHGLRLAVLTVTAASISGCAFGIFGLATNGFKQAVFFDSEPSDATVEVEGQRCQTPCMLRLSRRHEYTAVASKAGYKTQTGYVTKEADALVLYLDGFLMPYIMGTVNDLTPSHIFFTLAPAEAGRVSYLPARGEYETLADFMVDRDPRLAKR